jgi:hypothetical protein
MQSSPELLAQPAEEFKQRKAKDPTEALLPADFMPPSGLVRPNYSSAEGAGPSNASGIRRGSEQLMTPPRDRWGHQLLCGRPIVEASPFA